ncbi:MAG: protein translocase subunit SecD, partial [Clostridia bacterium]|nr:protein translocase subunit SecD [Clostridia bacterium]
MAQKHYIFIGIFFLAIFAGIFSYPNYFNSAVDYVNQKMSWTLPYFWQKDFALGLDLQGGVRLIYQADLSETSNKSEAMSSLRDVIERRINLFGVSEPVVQIQGDDRLVIELPGVTNVEQAIQMIGETPYLEFDEQRSEEETQQITNKIKEVQEAQNKGEDITKIDNWILALQNPYFKPTDLTGKYLKKATVVFDQTTYKPQIQLEFNDEGVKIFEDITSKNVGKPLAIYLDNYSIIDTTGD